MLTRAEVIKTGHELATRVRNSSAAFTQIAGAVETALTELRCGMFSPAVIQEQLLLLEIRSAAIREAADRAAEEYTRQLTALLEATECPHCGRRFGRLLTVPTHDYPPLCRRVCPGSGRHTRPFGVEAPLEKDVQYGKANPAVGTRVTGGETGT